LNSQTPSLKFVRALVQASDEEEPLTGDIVEDDDGRVATVLAQTDEGFRVRYEDTKEEADVDEEESDLYVVDRPSLRGIWEEQLKNEIPDGVSFQDGIEEKLKAKLTAGFEKLLEGKPDYHPGSEKKVRDLVHPSLFSYVNPEFTEKTPKEFDRWGRPFEASKFQWLGTTFAVDENGGVEIEGEINNLPRAENADLYEGLSTLFTSFLPMFESVYGYTETTKFYNEDLEGEHELPEGGEGMSFGEFGERQEVVPRSLKNRKLQVIPKIVEYNLNDKESLEGVWHVEGMSHEHILATGLCVVARDDNFEGGTLRFKRAYTLDEAGQLFWSVNQCRPEVIDEFVREGVVPIGSIETPEERMLVFPNCHIHKLTKMNIKGESGAGKRRIIIFWLVDPEHRITDMNDVSKPQESMTFEEACAARLELMEERRLHKQTHNIRTVSLCEH
jgi:hypothetical protein